MSDTFTPQASELQRAKERIAELRKEADEQRERADREEWRNREEEGKWLATRDANQRIQADLIAIDALLDKAGVERERFVKCAALNCPACGDSCREGIHALTRAERLTRLVEQVELVNLVKQTIADQDAENERLRTRNAALEERADAGDKFKAFVHRYLDQHGVPHGDPNNEHQKEGCRIGARLDLMFARNAALEGLLRECDTIVVAHLLEAKSTLEDAQDENSDSQHEDGDYDCRPMVEEINRVLDLRDRIAAQLASEVKP